MVPDSPFLFGCFNIGGTNPGPEPTPPAQWPELAPKGHFLDSGLITGGTTPAQGPEVVPNGPFANSGLNRGGTTPGPLDRSGP